jgi:hypothetical protein
VFAKYHFLQNELPADNHDVEETTSRKRNRPEELRPGLHRSQRRTVRRHDDAKYDAWFSNFIHTKQ